MQTIRSMRPRTRHAVGAGVDQPEKRLMLAVLQDAIDTLSGRTPMVGDQRRLVSATRAWMTADDSDWPFSFVAVCHALDLEPTWIRRLLGSPSRDRRTAGCHGRGITIHAE